MPSFSPVVNVANSERRVGDDGVAGVRRNAGEDVPAVRTDDLVFLELVPADLDRLDLFLLCRLLLTQRLQLLEATVDAAGFGVDLLDQGREFTLADGTDLVQVTTTDAEASRRLVSGVSLEMPVIFRLFRGGPARGCLTISLTFLAIAQSSEGKKSLRWTFSARVRHRRCSPGQRHGPGSSAT